MKLFFSGCASLLALTGFFSFARAETPVDLGTVTVSQIGHVFLTNASPSPGLAYDYFIDQLQLSGGGGVLSQVTVDWSTNHEFKLTISAPPGDMFLIQPPAVGSGKFDGSLWWANDFGSPGATLGTVSVSMVTLQGVLPDFSQSYCSVDASQSVFGFAKVDSAPFTRQIAFVSMVITGKVTPQAPAGGGKVFPPEDLSWLAFVSAGQSSGDPGPSVTIVPLDYFYQAPYILLPSLNFTFDQQGKFVLTYRGTLQWAADWSGPYSDVPGHPLGAFAISKPAVFPQRFFRVRYSN